MDVFRARQIVSEKMVALGGTLPKDITPQLAPQSSIMDEILLIGIQADSTSMMELHTLADWTVKPAILATGSVSQVTIIGGDYKQYQILTDPQRMDAYGVTMGDLLRAGSTMSANSAGSVIRDFGNEYALRGIARTTDLEELGATLVKTVNGKPITLCDVADMKIGAAVKMGTASQNAKPAVILAVAKQPNINTLSVTEKIEANLAEIQKSLPKDISMDTHIFRQADFIEASVNNGSRRGCSARSGHPVSVPWQSPHNHYLSYRYPLVVVGINDGALPSWNGHQHDDAGRTVHRHRFAGRRRHH